MSDIIGLITEDVSGLIVQFFFMTTIILMIRDPQKPPVATSLMTGIASIVFATGGSISATLPACVSFLNGVLWLVIGVQRYRQKAPQVITPSPLL